MKGKKLIQRKPICSCGCLVGAQIEMSAANKSILLETVIVIKSFPRQVYNPRPIHSTQTLECLLVNNTCVHQENYTALCF